MGSRLVADVDPGECPTPGRQPMKPASLRSTRKRSPRTVWVLLQSVLLALVLTGCDDSSSSPGAPPNLVSIVPAGGSSSGGVPATLTGSGFATTGAGELTVTFGGITATAVSVLHDTTVSCVPPPGPPGASVDVVVFNAIGTSFLVNAYTYAGLPTVTGVNPPSGTSLGGLNVTVNGSGFFDFLPGPNLVTFDGVPATNVVVVDDSTLTCDTPPGIPGTAVNVVVTNVNGTGTLPLGYLNHMVPTLTSVVDPSGTSLGGTSITLTGSGFQAESPGVNTVTFGAVPAVNVVVVSDTVLTCETPPGLPATLVDVEVSNLNGTATATAGFFYHAVPTLTDVSPPSGSYQGGTVITLTGSGFLDFAPGLNTVLVGGIPATNVVVVDDLTLLAETPPGSFGTTVDVEVQNTNGTAILPGGYSYSAAPSVVAVLPPTGVPHGGTPVTIIGQGFLDDGAGTNTVLFGTLLATGVVVVDDSTLTCVTPAALGPGDVDVSVTNTNGTGVLGAGFKYSTPPVLTSIAPTSGTSIGGTTVTLTGSGFQDTSPGINVVTFGGLPATGVVVLSDVSLTCVTPSGAAGGTVDVTVTNDNGSATLTSAYTYHPLPTLTAVSPPTGSSLGGTSATLTGSGFQDFGRGTNTVTFGGVAATNVVVVDDTSLTCDVPAGVPSAIVDVVVSNANGTATLAGGFTYHALPTLTAVTPNSGTSLGGTSVTLTGSGFQDDNPGTSTVTFDGNAATGVIVVSDTSITCNVPPGTAGAGVDVVVSNANGADTLAGGYAYHPVPTLSAVTPNSGTSLGGNTVTLIGTGFQNDNPGTNTITFDGTPATNVIVASDTAMTCDVPVGTAGSAIDVIVSNANGSATLTGGYTYHAVPTLAAVTPNSGTSSGGNNVTLTGTGFQDDNPGTNTVTFDGAAATNVIVVSDTSITCDVPAGTAGATIDVIVSNTNGSATLTGGYTYYALPTLTAVAPNSGTSLGGNNVALTGTGFQNDNPGTNAVTFDGAAATNVIVVSDTSITCDVPAGTAGAVIDVIVSNANGSATLTGGYTYHALPTLTAVTPNTGTPLGGNSVTLTGSGFQDDNPGANAVTFDGNAATNVVVLSDTSLTCDTPAGTGGATVNVVVANANGSDTLVGGFTYNAGPTLTTVTPGTGTSIGGDNVTLTGSGFQLGNPGANVVTFNGVDATNVVVLSDTSLTCDTPPGPPAGLVLVDITNDNGLATLAGAFLYHPLPTLTAVTPNSGTSLGGNNVTLTGTGFLNDNPGTNAATFGGNPATNVIVVSDTSLTCDVPAGTAGAAVDVVLTNDNGSDSLIGGYTYHALPTLTAVTPNTGTSLGANNVTLTGTGFQNDNPGTNAIMFGGNPATNVIVASDTSITCDVPAGTAGAAVDVVLTNDNGSDSLIGGYTYHALPTLTAATPNTGTSLGATNVTLTGTGFQNDNPGTNAITFGGNPATNVIVVSDTSITCDAPAGTAGAAIDVVLTNDNGSDSLIGGYTYYPLPTLTAVTPNTGTSLGANNVTLTGTGFQNDNPGTNAITFGGNPATNVIVVSDTSITCDVPAGTAGAAVDVVLTNDNGSDSLIGGYTYYALPTLTAVTPNTGTSLGANSVTLTGAGFQDDNPGTNAITFGGNPATNVLVVSDTSITCDAPAGTAGAAVDVVLTNDNGSDSLIGGYTYHALPTLTAVTPNTGTSLGANNVTLTGTGFQNDNPGMNAVTFGGNPATNVIVVSDTSITCDAPAGTAGAAVDVVLTNDNGSDSLIGGYTYHGLPTLTAVTPNTGTSLGATNVTLTGTGFQNDNPGTNAITFGGNPATNVIVVSDTSLTCDVPAGTAGAAVDVVLTNDNGSDSLIGGYTYHPLPTLTAVTPNTGTSLGANSVTLTGTGFQNDNPGTNAITFGGNPATNVIVVSDTSITCDVPAGTAGAAVDVVLTNDNGSDSLIGGYTYYPLPTLTAVTPNTGTSLGANSVTLTGTGFQNDNPGTNAITFGGNPATNVIVVSDTSLTCDAPAGTAGAAVDVVLTNDNGSDSLIGGYTYHPEPTLTSVAPTSGSSLGTTGLTLTGSGFQDNGAGTNFVTVGGTLATNLIVVSDTTITCDSPAGTPGTIVDVDVSNDNGTAILVGAYTYHALPTLTSVAPNNGTSLGGNNVTLTGTGFQNDNPGTNAVTFGGNFATNLIVVSDTSITCDVPAGTAGAVVDVVLTNDNGSDSLIGGYTYYDLPTLTAVTPNTGTSLGANNVTLTGTGFQSDNPGTNAITFGGNPATNVLVVSDTSITCDAPAGTAGAAVDVVLTNDNGSDSLIGGYTYYALPTLTAVTPNTGTSLGANNVTLTGTGFQSDNPGTNAITFGGNPATNVLVVSDTSITCDAPAGTAGAAVNVVLTNDNGSDSLVGGYTYYALPTLTAVTPNTGTSLGANNVTLTGTGFQSDNPGTNAITFGGNPATNVLVVSDTSITCDAPAGTAGAAVDVVLTNDNGSDSLIGGYTYNSLPTLTAVTPNTGTSLGANNVTLTGTGFQNDNPGTNAVTFGGNPATNVIVVSDTSITCDVPAGTAGAAIDVVLTNDNGSDSLIGGYTYYGLPTLTAATPNTGTSLGANNVTLTGTGFQNDNPGTNAITFGGNPATNVIVVSDTSITCDVPAGTAGTAVDVVLTNDNGSDSLIGGYTYHALPTLTAVTPNTGTSLGANSVTLTGTGFQNDNPGTNAITFGGNPATNVIVVSDTSITCDVPAGTAGAAVDVVLTNDNGSDSLIGGYTYYPLPTLTAVTPNTGTSLGANNVTLTGTGFQNDNPGTNAITFGGNPATNVIVASDTSVTCECARWHRGCERLMSVLTNDNGSDSLIGGYTYFPLPTLTAVTPNVGPVLGGNNVTLTGYRVPERQPRHERHHLRRQPGHQRSRCQRYFGHLRCARWHSGCGS